MTAKSADAFRTISEVADDLDVPQHVLRFWEGKFSQIRPLKRGGGRRYYRPDDVDLLRGIRRLLHVEGYTIKGVQKVLRDQGARVVVDLGRGAIQRIEPAVPDSEDEAPETAADLEPAAPLAREAIASGPQRARLRAALSHLLAAQAVLTALRAESADGALAVVDPEGGDGYSPPPRTTALAEPNSSGA